MRLWERICKISRDFGRGFTSIHETLEEVSQVFVRIWERIHKELQDFGRGFARIHDTLGEYLQDFRR